VRRREDVRKRIRMGLPIPLISHHRKLLMESRADSRNTIFKLLAT